MFKGGPSHVGIAQPILEGAFPAEEWAAPLGRGVGERSAAVVLGERILIGRETGLVAISTRDGSVLWDLPDVGSVTGTPAVAQGRVVVTGTRGAFAVDPADGAVLWARNTPPPGFLAPAAIDDGVVVVARYDAPALGLDARTGEALWTQVDGSGGLASPAIASGLAVVTDSGRVEIVALNLTTGVVQWARQGAPHAHPAVAGELLFAATGSRLDAIRIADGSLAWQREFDASIFHSPTVAFGTVFVGTFDADLVALDAGSGDIRWRTGLRDFLGTTPTVANGLLYASDSSGRLYAVHPDTGRIAWERRVGDGIKASPTIVGEWAFLVVYHSSFRAEGPHPSGMPVVLEAVRLTEAREPGLDVPLPGGGAALAATVLAAAAAAGLRRPSPPSKR